MKSHLYIEFNSYFDIHEFVDDFPFAERQCCVQIRRELKRYGKYIFSDSEDKIEYILIDKTIIFESEITKLNN